MIENYSKRQCIELEEMDRSENYERISDNKHFSHLNTQYVSPDVKICGQSIKKWATEVNRHFSEVQMTNRHIFKSPLLMTVT